MKGSIYQPYRIPLQQSRSSSGVGATTVRPFHLTRRKALVAVEPSSGEVVLT